MLLTAPGWLKRSFILCHVSFLVCVSCEIYETLLDWNAVKGKETPSKTRRPLQDGVRFLPETVFFLRPRQEVPVLSNEPSAGLIVESASVGKPKLSNEEQRKASKKKAKQKAESEETRYPILQP